MAGTSPGSRPWCCRTASTNNTISSINCALQNAVNAARVSALPNTKFSAARLLAFPAVMSALSVLQVQIHNTCYGMHDNKGPRQAGWGRV